MYYILCLYTYIIYICRSDNRNLVFVFTNPVDRGGYRRTVSLKDASRVIGPERPRSSLPCPAGRQTERVARDRKRPNRSTAAERRVCRRQGKPIRKPEEKKKKKDDLPVKKRTRAADDDGCGKVKCIDTGCFPTKISYLFSFSLSLLLRRIMHMLFTPLLLCVSSYYYSFFTHSRARSPNTRRVRHVIFVLCACTHIRVYCNIRHIPR